MVMLGGNCKKDIALVKSESAVVMAIMHEGRNLTEIAFATPAAMEHLAQLLHSMATNWEAAKC